MAERVFVMPDPGEGLEEGTIVEWLVAAGDTVELNQPLVEVETAKAAVEIPSPFAGTIVTLHGDGGADVAVGAPLVTFDVEGDAVDARVAANRRAAAATPPVRKLAKELAVDLGAVTGPGPGGRITEADVRSVAGEPDVDAPAPGVPSELSPTRRAIRGQPRAAGRDPAGDDVPHARRHGARRAPPRARCLAAARGRGRARCRRARPPARDRCLAGRPHRGAGDGRRRDRRRHRPWAVRARGPGRGTPGDRRNRRRARPSGGRGSHRIARGGGRARPPRSPSRTPGPTAAKPAHPSCRPGRA